MSWHKRRLISVFPKSEEQLKKGLLDVLPPLLPAAMSVRKLLNIGKQLFRFGHNLLAVRLRTPNKTHIIGHHVGGVFQKGK